MYVMLTLSDLMCAASSGILLRSSRASMTASLLYSFPTPHATTGCLSRCELMAQCRHRAIRATSLPALGRGGEGGRGRHMKHGKEHSSPGIHKAAYHVHTVLLRKKLAYYARSHARPFTRSTPVRFTPNARARMRTFSLVRHSTGTP